MLYVTTDFVVRPDGFGCTVRRVLLTLGTAAAWLACGKNFCPYLIGLGCLEWADWQEERLGGDRTCRTGQQMLSDVLISSVEMGMQQEERVGGDRTCRTG